MEVVQFDRLVLRTHEIYQWLVRRDSNGLYYYYIKPWTEKITFFLPKRVIAAHDTGNLKTLTLLESESGEWYFHTCEIYILPSKRLPGENYKPYK